MNQNSQIASDLLRSLQLSPEQASVLVDDRERPFKLRVFVRDKSALRRTASARLDEWHGHPVVIIDASDLRLH